MISLTRQTSHPIVQSTDCVRRQKSNKPHSNCPQRNGEHSDTGKLEGSTVVMQKLICIKSDINALSGNVGRTLEWHEKKLKLVKVVDGASD